MDILVFSQIVFYFAMSFTIIGLGIVMGIKNYHYIRLAKKLHVILDEVSFISRMAGEKAQEIIGKISNFEEKIEEIAEKISSFSPLSIFQKTQTEQPGKKGRKGRH